MTGEHGFDLGAPAFLHAVWAAPLVLLLLAGGIAAQRRALRRLADAELLPALAGGVSWTRRWAKALLLAASAGLLAFALARPRWDPEEQPIVRRGRDIVFLVDVSRSMLARDLPPNRLERAKLWLGDLMESLEGDRVALVAFAGAPVIKSPLTLDYGFVRLQLEELTPDSAPRGGTLIGDAIRRTLRQVFEIDPDDPEPDAGRFRDIVLITDGADQESFPVEAARQAAAAGVRIIALGVGSETGAPIPAEEGGFVEYQGETVTAALDAQTLRDVAAATPGGAFLNVGTGRIALDEVYRDLIAAAEQRTVHAGTEVRYEEKHFLFVWAALALLVADALLGERRRGRSPA